LSEPPEFELRVAEPAKPDDGYQFVEAVAAHRGQLGFDGVVVPGVAIV